MALGITAPYKDLGPGEITWDPGGTPVVIKPTFGGIILKDNLLTADVKEDGQGESPVDAVVTGREVSVEANFTRLTLPLMEKIIYGGVAGGTNLVVSNRVGANLYPLSKEIIIKPLVNDVASVTTTEWTHVFKCFPIVHFEMAFDNAGQRIIPVTFKCFPCSVSPNVGAFYRFGPA